MINFKIYLKEQEQKKLSPEFNEKKAVSGALKWLENKYGKELYKFKHIPNMKMEGEKTKTYDISVDGNEYELHLKLFDTNGDGSMDTLGFDVLPAIEEPEEKDEL